MTRRTFFFIGFNRSTQSGRSAKMWQIWRQERTLHTRWGPASLKEREPVFGGWSQEWQLRFVSEDAAKKSLERRIDAKLSSGYKPQPARRRARGGDNDR
jgi:predicted DNA-binding WGR domain protein